MPQKVYDLAKQMRSGKQFVADTESYKGVSIKTSVAGNQRLTGFGMLHKRAASYDYYRQIFDSFPEELEEFKGYEWESSQFEGMFRNTEPTPGGGRHTEYMTIRTIKPNSPGWYIPPMEAHNYLADAMRELQPLVERILMGAAEKDAAVAVAHGVEGL